MDYDLVVIDNSQNDLRWKSYVSPDDNSWMNSKGGGKLLRFHTKESKTQFPPTSLEEAEDLQIQLLTDILEIESQLGDKDRRDESGSRLYGKDYWTWRKRANDARIAKVKQRAKICKWIKEQNMGKRKEREEEVAASGFGPLLVDIADLLHKLAAEGVEFDEPEQALIDALDTYV